MKRCGCIFAGVLAFSLISSPAKAITDENLKTIKDSKPVEVEITELGHDFKIITIDKDGTQKAISDKFEQKPKFYKERTLIGLRDLSENLGWDVKWDQDKKIATVVKDGKTLEFPLYRSFMFINDAKTDLEVPTAVKNERIFLPLRFIGETLGLEVLYDGNTRTAYMLEPGAPKPEIKNVDAKKAMTQEEIYNALGLSDYQKYSPFQPKEHDIPYVYYPEITKNGRTAGMSEEYYTQEEFNKDLSAMRDFASANSDSTGWYTGDPLDMFKIMKSFGKPINSEIKYVTEQNNLYYNIYSPFYSREFLLDRKGDKYSNGVTEPNLINGFENPYSMIYLTEEDVNNYKLMRKIKDVGGDTSLLKDIKLNNVYEVNPGAFPLFVLFENIHEKGSIYLSQVNTELIGVQDISGKWYPVKDNKVKLPAGATYDNIIINRVMFYLGDMDFEHGLTVFKNEVLVEKIPAITLR